MLALLGAEPLVVELLRGNVESEVKKEVVRGIPCGVGILERFRVDSVGEKISLMLDLRRNLSRAKEKVDLLAKLELLLEPSTSWL